MNALKRARSDGRSRSVRRAVSQATGTHGGSIARPAVAAWLPRLGLAAVAGIYVALATQYASLTPLWQAPDEPAHYNYVAQLSDHSLGPPEIRPGDYAQDRLEELTARRFPDDLPIEGLEYEDHQPPLYYYVASIAFRLASDRPADRVRAMRLLGVLLGLGTVLLAWHVVRLGWPHDRLLALATAGFVGFLPMRLATTASVNNDPLAELLTTAALYVALARARGMVPTRRFVLLGGIVLGLALLTKVTAYLPVVGLLLGAEALARGGAGARRLRAALPGAVGMLALAMLLGLPWFVRNTRVYGPTDPLGLFAHGAVVAGQPTTADWVARMGVGALLRRFAIFTFESFWGVFGWLGVFLPNWIYAALALASAAALLGLAGRARAMRRTRDSVAPSERAALALFAIAVASACLCLVAYNATFVQHQGRYLFTALTPIACLFLLGLAQIGGWIGSAVGRVAPVAGGAAGTCPEPWVRTLRAVAMTGFSAFLALLALVSLHRFVVPGLS